MKRGTPGILGSAGAAAAALAIGASASLLGLCGPFTDVSDPVFCPFVLEVFYLGITTGTTPTTYDPSSYVTRLQMATFLSRTVDGVLKRSRRAALRQYWTTQNPDALGVTTLASNPSRLESDGLDIWIATPSNSSVSRVRAGSGNLLSTWTGATSPGGVLIAMGRVFVTGTLALGRLYSIDPSTPAGAVQTLTSNLGSNPGSLTFDGGRIWTANVASVSIVTPGAWTVTTVTAGFTNPFGTLFDGANVWVTDAGAARLYKLDAAGGILQTVTAGGGASNPAFDGTNIWVPNADENDITVLRASTGAVLKTLTGNGLSLPDTIAFDGERMLVTNNGAGSVSLWKAADLTPVGSFSTGFSSSPLGVCSDGIHFWIALNGTGKVARF